MALPCPGPEPISMSMIRDEFRGTNPAALSQYYRSPNGITTPNNIDVPLSGEIKYSDFFCAVGEIVVHISVTSQNVNVQSLFQPSDWTGIVPKRVIIDPGVQVGSLSTGSYALVVPAGFGGGFTLENDSGFIYGAAGPGNGGTGGPALFVGAPIVVQNNGTIAGGGGGGGAGGGGGRGGDGGPGVEPDVNCGPGICWPSCQNNNCTIIFGANNDCSKAVCTGRVDCADDCSRFSPCGPDQYQPSLFCGRLGGIYPGGSGGAGGSTSGTGGRGQGFQQGATPGAGPNPGSPGGGGSFGGGTGGPGGPSGIGGPGGGFGQPGTPGQTSGTPGQPGSPGNAGGGGAGSPGGGPGSGGLPGYYVFNNALVTWNPLGIVLGRAA